MSTRARATGTWVAEVDRRSKGARGATGYVTISPANPRAHRANGRTKVDWTPRAAMGAMGPAFPVDNAQAMEGP
jgi:hypothetical protein